MGNLKKSLDRSMSTSQQNSSPRFTNEAALIGAIALDQRSMRCAVRLGVSHGVKSGGSLVDEDFRLGRGVLGRRED